MTFGSISSQRPASFSLALPSRSMTNRRTEKVDMTRECISFIFDPRDMLLSLHIGFSFVRAAVAYADLERISSLDSSSETISPST